MSSISLNATGKPIIPQKTDSDIEAEDIFYKAMIIWDSIETPLYDELLEKLKKNGNPAPYDIDSSKENQDIFWSYVDKLGKGKFKGATYATDGTPQPIEMGGAFNKAYLVAFKVAEKGALPPHPRAPPPPLVPPTPAERRVAAVRRLVAEREERERREREADERAKSNAPLGNLLELNKLNKPVEKNLLNFKPTNQGLKNRGKELSGLWGGRKTYKNRKARKNKARKNKTRSTKRK